MVEGLEIVKKEVGMDPLTSPDTALAQELKRREEMVLGKMENVFLLFTWHGLKH